MTYTKFVWTVSLLTVTSFLSVMIIDLNSYFRRANNHNNWPGVHNYLDAKVDDIVDNLAAEIVKDISDNSNVIHKDISNNFNKLVNDISNDSNMKFNNFGSNMNVSMAVDRQVNASEAEMKYILFWNEAYGTKEYDFGFGREPFYTNLCPETRCVTTANRSAMPHEQFSAILFHQRSLNWDDVPDKKKRREEQRYIHWIMESAQYLYMDIHSMNGFFNWTMTYRKDSDFYRPYGRIIQTAAHPVGEELEEYIEQFGRRHRSLAAGKTKQAAWFVSHCATQARREMYVKKIQRHMQVDVYGKCGKLKCSRSNETGCYSTLEEQYKFYLSFENSVCADYVTEKYFNILKYNVIPVVYSGANMSDIAPPHSYISTLEYPTVAALTKYLQKVDQDDELYASYFWWKDFYQVRNSREDMAQSMCELCSALHNPAMPRKQYNDLHHWWVSQSHCRKLRFSMD